MVKQKSKSNPRKKRQFFRSIIPFTVVIVAISGLIAYLWISSEVDETLNELEVQQSIVVELNDGLITTSSFGISTGATSLVDAGIVSVNVNR